VQEIDRGSCQAVEACDHKHVVLAQVRHQPFELGATARRPRYLLLEHHFATGLREPSALDVEVLVLGGNARVAQFHAAAPSSVRKILQKDFVSHICFAKKLPLFPGAALRLRKS
jgi:hypothetical protein